MLITSADLKTQTKNHLAQMAKRLGVSGWNSLGKDQLVAAIVKHKKSPSSQTAPKLMAKKTMAKPTAAKKAATKSAANAGKMAKKSAGSSARAASKPAIKPAASSKALATSKKSAAAEKKATGGGKKWAATAKPAKKSGGSSVKEPTGKHGAAAAVKPAAKGAASKASSGKLAAKLLHADNGKTSHAAKANGSHAAPKPGSGKNETAKVAASSKKPATAGKPVKPSTPPTNPAVLQRIRELQLQRESTKDLSREFTEVKKVETPKAEPPEEQQQKDRIVLLVRDAYWLQVTWDITRRAVERARAAMAEHWHHAQPILRLLRLDDSGTTSAAETIERDIVIHGGVRNWYIDLNGTPGRFRVMIGYLSGNRFHMLAKSNIVRTPTPGAGEAADDHWSDIARDAERVFALSGGYDSEQETTELQEVFEDRLKRSMGGPQLVQYGSGAETAFRGRGGFHFDLEVELYVYGSTVPDGFVTLNGEPVKLRSDGTFSMRLPFPDRRQVLPAVACSRDGVQQRTVVIAVERNTKVMEPFSKEQDDQG